MVVMYITTILAVPLLLIAISLEKIITNDKNVN